MWLPFAKIEFAADQSQAGLDAFRILREYRKLHETQWDPSFTLDDKGRPISRIARGRKLCDQRANSIADMAATLAKVSTFKRPVGTKPKKGEKGKAQEFKEEVVKATVRWSNIVDAEFAEKWPSTVVHDALVMTKNNRRVIQDEPEAEISLA